VKTENKHLLTDIQFLHFQLARTHAGISLKTLRHPHSQKYTLLVKIWQYDCKLDPPVRYSKWKQLSSFAVEKCRQQQKLTFEISKAKGCCSNLDGHLKCQSVFNKNNIGSVRKTWRLTSKQSYSHVGNTFNCNHYTKSVK